MRGYPAIWLLGIVAVLVALGLSWSGLGYLHQARAHRWAVGQQVEAGRVPVKGLVPAGAAYRERQREVAVEALRLRLLEAAVDRRLLVERIEIEPVAAGASAALAAHVAVSGPEEDVLAFVSTIERSRPLIRFGAWRMSRATADGAVRLDGRASALWEGP